MKLSGVHLLLTYQCTRECDHCFVWGSPRQSGTMTGRMVADILRQAEGLGTVEWIYFEGGEPFLFYPTLVSGVREAARLGFKVGIVTNGYWATDPDDALTWLGPLSGLVQDLTVSDDRYHTGECNEGGEGRARVIEGAAGRLGIPVGTISIPQPDEGADGGCGVMYRGRAAETLVPRAACRPWSDFAACPHEDLIEPGRVHVDPLGNVHVCQGISVGNLFCQSLAEIAAEYDPYAHPVIGALLAGGPAGLARRHGVPHEDAYADACHLCYSVRRELRHKYPETLAPGQMYGVVEL